jgi:hypothetical protein
VDALTLYVKKLEMLQCSQNLSELLAQMQQIVALLPASSADIENMAKAAKYLYLDCHKDDNLGIRCDPPICGTVYKNDIRGPTQSIGSIADIAQTATLDAYVTKSKSQASFYPVEPLHKSLV